MSGDSGAPMSYLTLEPGTPVFASDGSEVGRVEHVLADPDDTAEGELTRKLRRAWDLISGNY